MSFQVSSSVSADNKTVLLSVQSPALPEPSSVHLAIVLDVSGSMRCLCDDKTAPGKEQSYLTRLDIAKHAIKTLITCLPENCLFTLVTYSDNANEVLRCVPMTPANKGICLERVEELRQGGCTNMWAGMEAAFRILTSTAGVHANQHMMVLTDGSRPDVPPGGFLKCMHAIKAPLEGRYPCAVHTFGFGYDLDTELLVELAKEGGGMYCFIPDGSMVGTVFINALSNALTTAAFHVRLRMAFPNECRVRRVLGAQEEEVNVKKVGDCTISRAMLSENRRWTVAIDFTEPLPEGLLAISLSLRTSSGENVNVWEFDRVAFNPDTYLLLQVRNQLLKITASGSPPPIDVSAITDNQCLYEVQQLLADINGEMALAVQPRENFQRWGRHYLPSLKRAHELELCNNFKDPGVQIYTSPLFERLRDDAEEAFVRIPQPKSTYVGYGAATTVSTQPVDMSNYIDRAGGCFHSTCEVLLHNGQTISITELKRGDVVGTHGAVVECIVKSPCNSETPWVRCEKSGLILTAWHPVMDIGDDGEEEWVFPVEMSTTTPWQEPPGEDDHGIMYNVVLEKGTGEFICVNGVWCATLGHGIMNHPVLTHPFLGTDRVRDGLKLCKGYAETGVVNVIFVRSPITKLLDGVIDMEV